MARRASREIVDMLDAFLRRRAAALSDDDGLSGVDSSRHTSAPIAFPEGALAAADLPPRDVHRRLAQLTDAVAAQVRAGELPRFDLPDLHRANAIFDARGNVFLGQNVRPLALDRHGGKAFMRLLLTVEAAADNLRSGVCTTKRGLFYQHRAKLPDDEQLDTDRALAALANVLRVRRRALGFVESRRGSVYGRLVLRDGGELVDLAQVGPAGRAIPRFTDDVEIVSSDAERIVIVEKDAIAAKLAQARWWDDARCIMVCGMGFPSVSTREFVRTLIDTLRIPAVIFADADPSGIQLALTYAHGSISTALETPWLACPNLSWAGVFPSDIDRHFRISDTIRFSETDPEKARGLLEHPSRAYVNDRVREELAILADRKIKVELDSLCSDLPRFVGYLQHKLVECDPIAL